MQRLGNQRSPLSLFRKYKCLSSLRDSNIHTRIVFSNLSDFLERYPDNSNVSLAISGHSYQIRHKLHFSLYKPSRTIDWIDPNTKLLDRYLQVLEFSIFRTEVKIKLLILNFYLSFIIDCFLPDDPKIREKDIESLDDHSLNMIVSL